MKDPRVWVAVAVAIGLGLLVKFIFPFSADAVKASVAIAPEILFAVGGFDVTPTIITSVIVFIIILVFSFLSTRNMQIVPSGLQNVIEVVIEQMVTLFEGIAGPMWRKFFTLAATMFILALVSNYVGLIPGAGSIGVIHVDPANPEVPQGIIILGDAPELFQTTSLFVKNQLAAGVPPSEIEEHPALVPFVRAPTSDINLPLAMALVSVIFTQIYGMQAQGLRYWTRFFSFGKLLKGDIAFGLIDVFVGLVELISEIGKIISFTFRLFGNIFAGEIILLIMAFLFLLLPFPFYAFEFFVAFIQAFVFAVLTMAFMRIATAEHGGEEHAEAHH